MTLCEACELSDDIDFQSMEDKEFRKKYKIVKVKCSRCGEKAFEIKKRKAREK